MPKIAGDGVRDAADAEPGRRDMKLYIIEGKFKLNIQIRA
jgi:hypothetical protein